MALDKDPKLAGAFEACPELRALADMAIAFADNQDLLLELELVAESYALSAEKRQVNGA